MTGKFGLFYSLLAKMPGATKEEIVYQYSGGDSLSMLYERAPRLYERMIADMKRLTAADGVDDELDRLRKRVMASIGGYFEKAGLYEDVGRRERTQKIIAIACRAGGAKDFGKMTVGQLRRVYYEFRRLQETNGRVEQVCEELEEEKEKRVIRRGCLVAEVP